MENFDGLIGYVAVCGLQVGLDRDTTINLIVSLKQTLNRLKPLARGLL